MEKPFGHDLDSARELNARLHAVLDEDQILRVDHFLGKQPVMELQCLRFANQALGRAVEPRHSVSEIQITMAENFGVEDRGKFYDAVGALRDVVQNHLLQVLAMVAMEPPVGASADDAATTRSPRCSARCRRWIPNTTCGVSTTATPKFPGWRRDHRPRPTSRCGLEIDNWRWSGVPIFLRAGKALRREGHRGAAVFCTRPGLAFLPQPTRAEPNQIVLRIDPDPGMRLQLSAHGRGTRGTTCTWTSHSPRTWAKPTEPYELLLHAAMTGRSRSFSPGEDSMEETWRIVQPLLDKPSDNPSGPIEPGSWGPDAAQS